MAKPMWKGYVSFGLVAIPINLYPIEKKNELRFHLLDSRDKARIRYERVNADTGKEVPWDEVVKAFEYKKGSYVVIDEEEMERKAPAAFKTIDIEEFVDIKDINPLYFERPYYLVPEGSNKKAYILLREALKRTNKVGVAKIIIRSHEYLSLIMADKHALILNLIRFPQELRQEEEFDLPNEPLKNYKISERELKIAIELIRDMTNDWQPERYHDEYRETLKQWIESQIPTEEPAPVIEVKGKEDESIDFMDLLKKSLKNKLAKNKKIS